MACFDGRNNGDGPSRRLEYILAWGFKKATNTVTPSGNWRVGDRTTKAGAFMSGGGTARSRILSCVKYDLLSKLTAGDGRCWPAGWGADSGRRRGPVGSGSGIPDDSWVPDDVWPAWAALSGQQNRFLLGIKSQPTKQDLKRCIPAIYSSRTCKASAPSVHPLAYAALDKCVVCRIICHGFSAKKEGKAGVGVFTVRIYLKHACNTYVLEIEKTRTTVAPYDVPSTAKHRLVSLSFTTSTSGRTYESIEVPGGGDDDPAATRKALLVCRVIARSGRTYESIEVPGGGDDDPAATRKALLVCRVIAGRVHKPLENLKEFAGQTGFDSSICSSARSGPTPTSRSSTMLNPRALLPCFVVICKA
uniref:Uncharacterized protein n=1 Tax=Oryza brachyantha TaxID=4533 RepID=J3L3X6_ORYBR